MNVTVLVSELSNLAFWVGIFVALSGVVFALDRLVRARKTEERNRP
jgi:hypothetical protein